jgi:mannose-6-phosphate isomerase-like protein (cupin superfamily)
MKTEIIDKPWGREIIWAKNSLYAGKILEVKEGKRLSLQYHEKKTETMYILQGKALLEVQDKATKTIKKIALEKDNSIDIQPKTIHRLIAIEDSKILEVSTPELTDVVRLQDDFGRHANTNKMKIKTAECQ